MQTSGVRIILTGHFRAVLERASRCHIFQYGSKLVSTSGTRIYVKTRGRQFESSARTEREKKKRERKEEAKKKREGTMKIVSSIHIRMMWYIEHQQKRVSVCLLGC